MEWKVQNALNRDVERQHLNKILKEIEAALGKQESSIDTSVIAQVVREVLAQELPNSLSSVTVTLRGDATGTGTSSRNGRVEIDVTVSPDARGIGDAPTDNSPYWRINGTWQQVPPALESIFNIDEAGILAIDEWGGVYGLGIEGTEDEIVVENGRGEGTLNPIISLAKIELEAGETIHSLRAVMAVDGEAFHPDTSINQDAMQVVGISLGSGSVGDVVLVQSSGRLREASWTWTPGHVYVGDEGVLTQAPSSTEWLLKIGRALDATTLEVNVSTPLLRNL